MRHSSSPDAAAGGLAAMHLGNFRRASLELTIFFLSRDVQGALPHNLSADRSTDPRFTLASSTELS